MELGSSHYKIYVDIVTFVVAILRISLRTVLQKIAPLAEPNGSSKANNDNCYTF